MEKVRVQGYADCLELLMLPGEFCPCSPVAGQLCVGRSLPLH